jgi:hypothetical protein
MKHWTIALAAATLWLTPTAAQDVIDRIVSRVGAEIVTLSDIERCRRLRLLGPDADSADGWRIAFENRLLILHDMRRPGLEPPTPTADALAARRQAWEATLAGDSPLATQLEAAGMSPEALDAWLADDVRIQLYLGQRFGRLQSADRATAAADFVARLRLGAGLR